MLIDTHAHINDEQYVDGGKSIIRDMKSDNLAAVICVGCDESSSTGAVEIAEKNENVFAAVGVHPYYPETVTAELLSKFKELTKSEKVVAIGEFGLDYHTEGYDGKEQIRAMNAEYELAREVRLPVIFHVREAAGDFTQFLRLSTFPESGVMHCFSGSLETAKLCLDKGLYLAFGGKLTYSNAKHLAEVAKYAPMNRILLETDSPYLTPSRHAGELNYPKYVAEVRDAMAEIRNMDKKEVERQTAKNALTLFTKMKGVKYE